MLPNSKKPWAKTLARTVIGVTLVVLGVLAYYLQDHDSLHIPEVVGIFLLFLTIVPPNLAVIYPWLLPSKNVPGNSVPLKRQRDNLPTIVRKRGRTFVP